MRALAIGDTVDLYYYGHDHNARDIRGKIDCLDTLGVSIVTSIAGDLQFFPWGSVQRLILIEAHDPQDSVRFA